MLRWLISALLGLAVILSLLLMLEDPATETEPEPTRPSLVMPDYWIEQGFIERFDESGERIMELEASHMAHFPDDERTELQEVQIRQAGPRQLLWVMDSDYGMITGDRSLVELRGDVRMQRRLPPGPITWLFTDSLDFHPERELARTEDAIRMERGQSLTTGRGLEADLARDRITIKSEVRTRYVAED